VDNRLIAGYSFETSAGDAGMMQALACLFGVLLPSAAAQLPRRMLRFVRRLWPHIPLGTFLVIAGALNVITGLLAETRPLVLSDALSQQVSIAVLGTGAQIVFGVGLAVTGVGLFWRLRIAWTFALLLLLITIGINIAKGHYSGSLIVPAIVLLALLVWKNHFDHRTAWGSSLMSLMGVTLVLVYGTFGIYLFGDQFDPKITTWLTALYFLVETLSTTGYGDYAPVTPLTQGFMISVWVFGLGVFATALAAIASSALTSNMARLISPGGMRRMEKNHVILVGNGLIAANTADELQRRGIRFVQLIKPESEPPSHEQPVVTGDASDNETLRKAGVAKARLLIAADDDEGENAFVCLATKDIKPELTVLVRRIRGIRFGA
jgi:voltage-gated potassium channel